MQVKSWTILTDRSIKRSKQQLINQLANILTYQSIYESSTESMCNKWTIVARPGLEHRAFCWPCEHSTTELPSHPVISPTTVHLKPTRLHTYHFYLIMLAIDKRNRHSSIIKFNHRLNYSLIDSKQYFNYCRF